MRETRADTRQAVLQAIGLHIVLFALMFAGLFWTHSNRPISAAGSPVEATLIDANALSPTMRETLRERPEPVEEPEPQPEPLPEPVEEETAQPPQPVPEPTSDGVTTEIESMESVGEEIGVTAVRPYEQPELDWDDDPAGYSAPV